MNRKMTPIAGLEPAKKTKKRARAKTPAKKPTKAKTLAQKRAAAEKLAKNPTRVIPPEMITEEPPEVVLGKMITWEKVEPLHPSMLKLALDIIDNATIKGSEAQSVIRLKIELARVAGVGKE